jgi:hypothetical protein
MPNSDPRLALTILIVLVASLTAGCAKPIRPGFAVVNGEVRFDDTAVPSGFIQFAPHDSKLAPESAPITAGRYSGIFRIGPSRVRIIASRPSKKISPVTGEPFEESFIPERYNSNTELSADVVAGRTNTFDFRLQSSGGKQ